MAVRKIEYTVSADGITPAVMQKGGVQGDHRATELVFTIDTELWKELSKIKSGGGSLIYRFDAWSGDGNGYSSDTEELTEKTVKYQLEEFLTRCGGVVRVVLVISYYTEDKTVMELYSFPATLSLRNIPDIPCNGNWKSLSMLNQVSKEAARIAQEAAKTAKTAAEETKNARAYLDGGAELVFDGGDSAGEIEVLFAIDGEMSDTSENAVMNKVVKDYIDSITDNLLSRVYPVGSLYWSNKPTDPGVLFGGTWRRITNRFVYAIGDDMAVGTTGGNAEVTLTENQIPQHNHRGLQWNGSNINIGGPSNTTPGYRLTGKNDVIYEPTHLIIGKNTYNNESGSQEDVDIMPPYIGYYCWIRVNKPENNNEAD